MRRIVIHHTHKISNLVNLLEEDDVVFFDDCLYSQYIFLKENNNTLKQKNITCILGFTPKAVRPEGCPGIVEVESNILHDWLNSVVLKPEDDVSGEMLNGFMTLSEVKELLLEENIYLALHGGCHFKLENIYDKFQQYDIFYRDLKWGINKLKEFGLSTNTYVFPYEFQPFLGVKILENFGFYNIFAASERDRLPIETLIK